MKRNPLASSTCQEKLVLIMYAQTLPGSRTRWIDTHTARMAGCVPSESGAQGGGWAQRTTPHGGSLHHAPVCEPLACASRTALIDEACRSFQLTDGCHVSHSECEVTTPSKCEMSRVCKTIIMSRGRNWLQHTTTTPQHRLFSERTFI